MKKVVALLLAVLLVATLLPTMAFAQEKKILTVKTWDVTAGSAAYLQATEAAFEAAFPDVDLQYVDTASQEYAILVAASLAGGDTSDVIDVKEVRDLQNWIAQGYVENLESYIAADSYNLAPYVGMEKYYRGTDDALYALPYRSDFWVLFYNKTLFDNAGVAYPTADMTWDEYAELAKKMTSGEGVDKIYGAHYHTWLSCVANWAVCDGVNTLADGEYSDLKYFYDLNQSLEEAGAVMEYTELRAAGLHYRAAFEQGNIAMIPMGYWLAGSLIADKVAGNFSFDWGITAVPHLEGVAAGSSFGSLTGAAVNKNSANKDLAWKFISWRASEEGAKAIAALGTRPAYVSEDIAATLASVAGFPQDDASKAALVPAAVSIEWPVVDKVSEIQTILNEEHTNIMSRSVTVDEGIENMNTRVAELLGK